MSQLISRLMRIVQFVVIGVCVSSLATTRSTNFDRKQRPWAVIFKVISGWRTLFYEGGNNRFLESIWERALNEKIIY